MGAELAEKDKHLLEVAFYDKPFHFSYSSLNRLLTAPNIFYKEYVLKEKEIKTEKYLLEGTLIHYLILDHQGFDEKFIVTPEDLPSENSIKVAHHVFEAYKKKVEEDVVKAQGLELCDFPEEIVAVLKEMNLHQALKDDKDLNKQGARTGDQKRVDKIVEPKTEEYFKYLKNKGRREIIDSGMLDRCTVAANKIKANAEIRELLGMDREPDGIKFGVYNELELKMELGGFPFGLRGILDNMTVDVEAKLIRINDFKTSGKALADFPDSLEYWKYWLQAAIYLKLAMEFLKNVIDDSWSFEIRFIVFDKYDQIYAFPVSPDSLTKWVADTAQVLEEARWHYENKDYTLPYKFSAGEVTL